jgi:hypothetical protein
MPHNISAAGSRVPLGVKPSSHLDDDSRKDDTSTRTHI